MSTIREKRAFQRQQTLRPSGEIFWICRRCRRPSYLMVAPDPVPDDKICRGCVVRIANGLPIEVFNK